MPPACRSWLSGARGGACPADTAQVSGQHVGSARQDDPQFHWQFVGNFLLDPGGSPAGTEVTGWWPPGVWSSAYVPYMCRIEA